MIGAPAIDPWIKALSGAQGCGIWAVHRLKDPQAVEPLIKALRVVGPPMNALRDEGPSASPWVATALGAIGEPAIAPLIEAMGDKNPEVRACAADALTRIDDPRAFAPLCKALGDASPIVRLSAAQALGTKGSQAVAPLSRALGDEDREVRCTAVMAC